MHYKKKDCNELVGAECQSFAFCFLDGECSLSSDLNDTQLNDPSNVLQTNNCDIYESM
jgi:hypothetical protein